MNDIDKIADIIMKRHHSDLRYANAQGIAREIIAEVAVETLRDKFAGQALIGQLASNPPPSKEIKCIEDFKREAGIHATIAYIFADAMLAERAK